MTKDEYRKYLKSEHWEEIREKRIERKSRELLFKKEL